MELVNLELLRDNALDRAFFNVTYYLVAKGEVTVM